MTFVFCVALLATLLIVFLSPSANVAGNAVAREVDRWIDKRFYSS